jgi:iron complex transport system substrate-binding protein
MKTPQCFRAFPPVGFFRLLGRVSLGLLLCLAVTAAHGEETRTVRYYGDQEVALPMRIQRIATAWEAQNSIIAMLGYGPQIVASTRIVREHPVFRRFVPSIVDTALVGNGAPGMPIDLNVEELLRVKPDLLFVAGALPAAKKAQLERAGIAVVALRANSMQNLLERVSITGEILGPEAERRAREYRAYFADNVARARRILARVPAEKRLTLYHALGDPLTTSGRPSLNQDWMDLGGAVNIAEHWLTGSSANGKVSLEAIVAANPDVIVAMRAADAEFIRSDPRWQNLRAVRTGRVYVNPRGMYWWCRETSEEALQFLWLVRTLYPEAAAEIDMPREVRAFYKRFYGYDLSEADVADFLVPKE